MTMKDDEIELFNRIKKFGIGTSQSNYKSVKEIAEDMGMNLKRASYLCEKWANKGLYEWGINILQGWLTEEGLRYNMEVI